MVTQLQVNQLDQIYSYAASLRQRGLSDADIVETLVADGIAFDRAEAIVRNIHRAEHSTVGNFIAINPTIQRLRTLIKR